MKIKIIVVDRTRSPFLQEGELFYLKRLRRYIQVDWVEAKAAKITKARPEVEILSIEGERIAKKLAPKDYVVSLDPSGYLHSSEEFAEWLRTVSDRGQQSIAFVIGGALGLANEFLERSHKVLSLSRLTFTHEMSRLVLLEQLYRGFTILHGEKYHK
jgi:23S rRNA (pseudouridine1915-N3)-methyltransferase